ncbi:MarR family transcriptional regulator [Paenibacillus sp. Marseille-P2973]|uniref:MarR family winged helix-turn-helix transcriptional regulator n=1 Tax=Paenibacillus TaxID=44249 RepID=UPI001B38E27C|nr:MULTISPECIES: MarR family transcriptional regulator [Paenibacillus]MBQ4898879.1 MarR family transcriptional regulator [Paenibacillus sp. Marseille-P2973]MDN4066779.1 MarR family transcriptional regulator [Paenibacillus vini]
MQGSKELIERYMAAYFTVTKRLHGEIREVLQDDLTMDQFQIIDYIVVRGNVTSTELAESFAVGKSSITAIITRLADKGILERTRDEDDRRVVYLSLTDRGLDNYKKAQAKIMETVSTYLVHFGHDEVEGFISVFEKLANLLEEGSGES